MSGLSVLSKYAAQQAMIDATMVSKWSAGISYSSTSPSPHIQRHQISLTDLPRTSRSHHTQKAKKNMLFS